MINGVKNGRDRHRDAEGVHAMNRQAFMLTQFATNTRIQRRLVADSPRSVSVGACQVLSLPSRLGTLVGIGASLPLRRGDGNRDDPARLYHRASASGEALAGIR